MLFSYKVGNGKKEKVWEKNLINMGIGKFFFHNDFDDLCRLGDCLFGVERRMNGG